MKKFLTLILTAILLTSCQNEKPEEKDVQPTEEKIEINETQTNPTKETVEVSENQTELSKKLGITQKNYPKIDGSTSTFKLVFSLYQEILGKPLEKESASKTVPSYKMLIDGDVDMIFVPYASESVLKEAKDKNVELEFHKIAAEALIFITPKDNTTENITKEQVRKIYLDYGITNWKELGGPDTGLVPISRNSDSGSQSQMDNLILDNEPIKNEINDNYVELTMEGMLEQVAFYHTGGLSKNKSHKEGYALGYTLYNYLKNINDITGIEDHLKILSFENVIPTEENIADGTYPLADGYYAVIRKDASETSRKIIDWLQSDEGKIFIKNINLIPAK